MLLRKQMVVKRNSRKHTLAMCLYQQNALTVRANMQCDLSYILSLELFVSWSVWCLHRSKFVCRCQHVQFWWEYKLTTLVLWSVANFLRDESRWTSTVSHLEMSVGMTYLFPSANSFILCLEHVSLPSMQADLWSAKVLVVAWCEVDGWTLQAGRMPFDVAL